MDLTSLVPSRDSGADGTEDDRFRAIARHYDKL